MKRLLILLLIISSVGIAQESTSDSVQIQPKKVNPFIGVDLFNPAISLLSDKQGFEFFATTPFYKKWQLAAEIGYDKNTFEESGWDIEAQGIYVKAGANWFISQDTENPNMGFFTGFRIGYSPYSQTVNQYLIQGVDTPHAYGSIPKHNANAYWLEPVVGGRVQIVETRFYIDTSVHIKMLLGGSGERDIDPMVVPGFGRDKSGLNIGVKWGLAYALPF